MSEFDKYLFEDPVNIEDNPRAVAAMSSLVEAVFPIQFENMPPDVLDVSMSRAVDEGITLRISAFQELTDEATVTAYSIEIEEEYCWPNDPDTLQYERRCEIGLVPAKLELGLVSDKKSEYDQIGDLLQVTGADTEYLDSHTLFYISAKIQSLPGAMDYLIDNL